MDIPNVPAGTDLLTILRQHWRYEGFRPPQEEIIRSILAGRDTIALLPTGGGKSLCYQLPALALPGLCLVISPLVALMKDQTDGLRRRNITAFAIHAGMTRKEVINTFQVASNSNCKLLYVSPERLETPLFLEHLAALNVDLIAVDEAHCVSQWGYDFRPPYLRIAALRNHIPGVPVLALTASATPEVLEDTGRKLELKDPMLFRMPFTRANLSYSFFKVDNKIKKITEILASVQGSSIIYCKTRQATREIADWLVRQGISAAAYHAGLSHEERVQRQENWVHDRLRVIVGTNAFGMGIDKAAVRTVIHADPPDAVENYYQEAGRGGRDGRKAYAILLAGDQDIVKLEGQPAIRFPPVEEIRPIYQQLMNYLQLPVGAGEGQYFEFDLTTFTRRFNLGSPAVLNVLKVLEQEGLLSFQQQVFLPARLQFVTKREILMEFGHDHPALEPLIHTLLRTYEGIMDQQVTIRERQLSWLTHQEPAQLTAALAQLQAFHVIDYTPTRDSPQLYFFRNRPAAEELYIDPVGYRERKEQYATRVRGMLRYIRLGESQASLGNDCRSRYLAHYFGDKEAADCGICDNCLRRHAGARTTAPPAGTGRPRR